MKMSADLPVQADDELPARYTKETRATKISLVLPPDTNHHGTMFGGKLMAYIDDVATISATRLARHPVVTASTDSVDFLKPVKQGNSVCVESYVTWSGKTSMEVFVKVTTEDLLTGDRAICTMAFLTFVALDEQGHPTRVPRIIPETPQEIELYETAPERMAARRERRAKQLELVANLGVKRHWEY